ncbi:MAG: anti-sigma factor antagonist [Lachnospiraceae bacterium]|nr:anti-sigma factor antagonist [Lachnospiraceae bacterium]
MKDLIRDSVVKRQDTGSCRRIGTVLVICPTQDLDHHYALSVRKEADDYIDRGQIEHLIFDFSRITFMDSSGIGVIMGRYKKVIFQGGNIACCGVGKEVERILSLAGLFRIMKRYPGVEEALTGLKEGR